MPIIKSAKKRVRVTKSATAKNAKIKKDIRAAVKSFKSKMSADSLAKAYGALDKAGKHNLIHRNKVARLKKRLAAQAKTAGVKLGATKKTAIKKPSPAKKPAAKKSSPAKLSKKVSASKTKKTTKK